MNVQISPPNTPTGTRPGDADEPGHTRTWLLGGGALILALGGFWYFTQAGDGAKPGATWRRRCEWVWPRPATCR
jgi:hypothetical protein